MTRAKIIFDTVEFFPKQFNMPNMSSIDATFHAVYDWIYSLHNTAPENLLDKLGNGHNKALRTLEEILSKCIPPAIPLRVPAREVVQDKPKEVNQERVVEEYRGLGGNIIRRLDNGAFVGSI